MITRNDQEELFTLIAKNLRTDVTCWAFGGTAMMYYGFKEETKDIDLLFETEGARAVFIEALRKLGFTQTSLVTIYVPEKLKDKTKPVMYKRGDVRLDLFAKKVFRTALSDAMKAGKGAVHDYKQGRTLSVRLVRAEHIVYLKGITERDKDAEDILAIVEQEKGFSWDVLVDEAVWQHRHGDSWALLDTQRTLNELKRQHFIEEKHLKRLYEAQGAKA